MSSTIPATSGIYRIVCVPTGKLYIGSALNLRTRWYDHCKLLQRKTHHNPKLQNAWNKYGKGTFTFEVLELVLPISLTAREQYWLDKLKPFGKRGFNLAPVAGSNFGRKDSPEVIERRRLRQLGTYMSDEAKLHMAQAQTGRTHTTETREKMRLSALGRPRSAETKARSIAAKTKNMKTLIVTAPDGAEYEVLGIKKFCREHALHRSSLLQVAKGKQHQHKGWKARFPD